MSHHRQTACRELLSKIKHDLRKTRARTVEALYQALSQALTTMTADNATGFFEHVGVCIH
jgi:hypothetical protein